MADSSDGPRPDGRREKQSLLTDVLPDRGFDVAISQRRRWSFDKLLVAMLFPSCVK